MGNFFLSKSKQFKHKSYFLLCHQKQEKIQGHLVPTLGGTHNSNTLREKRRKLSEHNKPAQTCVIITV